jgi:hypothetical protein
VIGERSFVTSLEQEGFDEFQGGGKHNWTVAPTTEPSITAEDTYLDVVWE